MPQRELSLLLEDILSAADVISRCVGGKTLEEYAADVIIRSAVERQFEIIGEAIRRVLDAEPGLSLRLPEAAEVIAFRNLLAHGYHLIAHDQVWAIIRRDLPVLRTRVGELAKERAKGA